MSDYPRSWRWDQDGSVVDGTYVKTTSAPGDFGPIPILTLKVGDEDRAVWVTGTALQSKLGSELSRRNVRNFDPGERIVITRGAEKRKSAANREYWPFAVDFPDAEPPDAASLFGVDAVRAASGDGPDDDIPF